MQGSDGSVTSGSIAVASLATTVDSALEAMSNIGSVDVTRTVSGGPAVTFTITFTTDYGNIGQMTCAYGSGTCTPSTPTEVRCAARECGSEWRG